MHARNWQAAQLRVNELKKALHLFVCSAAVTWQTMAKPSSYRLETGFWFELRVLNSFTIFTDDDCSLCRKPSSSDSFKTLQPLKGNLELIFGSTKIFGRGRCPRFPPKSVLCVAWTAPPPHQHLHAIAVLPRLHRFLPPRLLELLLLSNIAVNWLQMDFRSACNAQLQRPLWRLQQANYGGCVFAVSAFAFAHIYTLNSSLAPPPS